MGLKLFYRSVISVAIRHTAIRDCVGEARSYNWGFQASSNRKKNSTSI